VERSERVDRERVVSGWYLCGGVCRREGGQGQQRSLCRAFWTETGLGALKGAV